MLRVALFFDGKNHMKDLRRTASDRWLDHGALADWVVGHVEGDQLAAAYYYTGVPSQHDENRDRNALNDLLDELDRRPGFFVKRFPRRASTRECPHCDQMIAYTEEKMVDTSLVTDMVMLAVADAFDVAVVFSGDLDVAPGIEALHRLGKRAWIATFGDYGLSRTLTRFAWSHIDLLEHIESFSYADLAASSKKRRTAPSEPDDVDAEILRELRRAEAHFSAGGGFVGAHYFIHRWKGHAIPDAPEERRLALQRLMAANEVEAYAVDGKTALRSALREPPSDEPTDPQGHGAPPPDDDDEATIEIRVPETVRRLGRRRRVVSNSDD
jgi:uncharacterized LabA/DUF88 family protein